MLKPINTEIIAQSKNHLKELIALHVQKHGNDCNLNHIDVSHVTDMSELFYKSSFVGNISAWNTRCVTTMQSMFKESAFNGDLSKWNVSSVINTSYMFASSTFDQDISAWDVSHVDNMQYMFYQSKFNQAIVDWKITKVHTAYSMFKKSAFNQNLSQWDMTNANVDQMLYTPIFQSALPRFSKHKHNTVVYPGYRGCIGHDLTFKQAGNILGKSNMVDTYLNNTASQGFTRVHVERAMSASKCPPWCSLNDFKQLKSYGSMCHFMDIPRDEWAAYAHQRYLDSCENTEPVAIADVLNFLD